MPIGQPSLSKMVRETCDDGSYVTKTTKKGSRDFLEGSHTLVSQEKNKSYHCVYEAMDDKC